MKRVQIFVFIFDKICRKCISIFVFFVREFKKKRFKLRSLKTVYGELKFDQVRLAKEMGDESENSFYTLAELAVSREGTADRCVCVKLLP